MVTTQPRPDHILLRFAGREAGGIVIMALALFLPAGTLDWWQAWTAVAVMAAWTLATGIVILRCHPDLFVERLGPRKGTKRWDMAILGSLGLLQLIRYILAGLDLRFDRQAGFIIAAQLFALGMCILGYALFVWATASNAYFSQIVRVQTERGHKVVSSGPYRIIRHPAYLGAVLFELFIGILLDSWIALGISLVCVILLILRTALEDSTLQRELAGYEEYTQRVRFRLIPGLW